MFLGFERVTSRPGGVFLLARALASLRAREWPVARPRPPLRGDGGPRPPLRGDGDSGLRPSRRSAVLCPPLRGDGITAAVLCPPLRGDGITASAAARGPPLREDGLRGCELARRCWGCSFLSQHAPSRSRRAPRLAGGVSRDPRRYPILKKEKRTGGRVEASSALRLGALADGAVR